MRFVVAAAIAVLSSPVFAAAAPVPFHDLIVASIDDFARPKFTALATEAGKLKDDVAVLCATPSPAALGTAQGAFKSTVLAFSGVEFMRQGPLGVGDRLERLLLWPDTKGIALKQVQAALAQQDATAADPATLQGKSVAMQGLVAVEFLLFGTGADDLGSAAGAYRCSYAMAAATLIAGLTGTIRDEWMSDAPNSAVDNMLVPKPDGQDYRSEREVIDKLAGALTYGTDLVRDQRLSPVLSLLTSTPKPKSALFWRSGMTLPALNANIAGLHDLFVAVKFPEALAGEGAAWITHNVLFEFDSMFAALGKVPGPIDKALADPAQFQQLKYVAIVTRSLDTLIGDNLGSALGLSSGFSALDGD